MPQEQASTRSQQEGGLSRLRPRGGTPHNILFIGFRGRAIAIVYLIPSFLTSPPSVDVFRKPRPFAMIQTLVLRNLRERGRRGG
jgi:hypothetical protein